MLLSSAMIGDLKDDQNFRICDYVIQATLFTVIRLWNQSQSHVLGWEFEEAEKCNQRCEAFIAPRT